MDSNTLYQWRLFWFERLKMWRLVLHLNENYWQDPLQPSRESVICTNLLKLAVLALNLQRLALLQLLALGRNGLEDDLLSSLGQDLVALTHLQDLRDSETVNGHVTIPNW